MNLFARIRIARTDPTENLLNLSFDHVNEISTKKLKSEISTKANLNENEIEILYRGRVLEEAENLDIAPNSILQVIKKSTPTCYSPKTYTKEDCEKIAKLFDTVTGTQINIGVRINILSKILLEYPEFRKNLGAQALIRDSVLFHSLEKPEVIEKIAENYSVICEAAEFIVKTTKKELAKNVNNVKYTTTDEIFSDYTSSSSEEENSNSNNSNSQQRMIRRISHDQLQAALSNMAATGSRNSLSNIAQRYANLIEEEQNNQQQNNQIPQEQSTSTSSSSQPENATPPVNRISHDLLTTALLNTFNSRNNRNNSETQPTSSSIVNTPPPQESGVENMDTQETPTVIVDDSNLDELPVRFRTHQYANEMRLMREMGLKNDEVNANVLTITGGNVENAVNLVLTSNFENEFGLGGDNSGGW